MDELLEPGDMLVPLGVEDEVPGLVPLDEVEFTEPPAPIPEVDEPVIDDLPLRLRLLRPRAPVVELEPVDPELIDEPDWPVPLMLVPDCMPPVVEPGCMPPLIEEPLCMPPIEEPPDMEPGEVMPPTEPDPPAEPDA